MRQKIAHIALLVQDYDEAIAFYTQKLNFELLEDTQLDANKRWVRIAPPNTSGTHLLLAKASNEQQRAAIGNQAGGRVFLFLFTDDAMRDYRNLLEKGVDIVRPLNDEPFGKVFVFKDLYGNLWDLIEPKEGL